LIDYAGFNNVGNSAFTTSTINFKVVFNAFFLLLNQEDYTDALDNARQFVDNVIQLGAVDSTLGGSLLRFKVDNGTPPLSYRRTSYNYILTAVSASVLADFS